MKFNRMVGVIVVTVMVVLMGLVPVQAQADELPVLILPVDQAQFLPGSMYDFRVEVHAAEFPENFAVTVNGEPAADVFGAEATEEAWEFGGRVARYNAEGVAAADFDTATLAGEYYNSTFGTAVVEVAADNSLTITIGSDVATAATGEDVLTYLVAGGAADGQALTFGLDAEGTLTGFQVAGQDFGVLTSLPTKSSSVIWRGLVAPAAGEYVIEVTAGATVKTVTWTVREAQAGTAKNVVLFIADGMTIPMITAARAARGITEGRPNNPMVMDGMEYRGFASTSSIDSLMADSANTASSINTGHIGSINATGSYSDTSPSRLDDPRTETLAEILKRTRGYAIGVVSTADFSDATPAATWAHGRDRSDANRAEFVVQALDFGVDVLLGGGGQRFLPQSSDGSRRADERDMYAEFDEAGYTLVTTNTELQEVTGGELPSKLLGVFNSRDMSVWLDRNVYVENLGDFTDQPNLTNMTLAALEVLNTNPNGFYLTVEAASVDKQIHPLDQERALSDLIEFDKAIGATVTWLEEKGLTENTLIVVTADHGHGYEVFGTVDVAEFNAATDDTGRIAAVGLYAAAGYPTYTDEDGDGFPDWDASVVFAGAVNNHPTYTEDFQVSAVPRSPAITDEDGNIIDNPEDDPNGILLTGNIASTSGVHTLQDVPVYANGAGADYFNGSYHQSEIFFGMAAALGLDPSVEGGMVSASAPVTTAGVSLPGGIGSVLLLAVGLVGGLFLARRRQ
ncbi:MAG: alkaline phosphatase [Armatimonadetes bacterium]|nr:alkaline phosphatase [Anaerolineae bacterium]